MFHKEGFKIIVISTLLVGIGIFIIDFFFNDGWINKTLTLVLLFFYIIILQFSQDFQQQYYCRVYFLAQLSQLQ